MSEEQSNAEKNRPDIGLPLAATLSHLRAELREAMEDAEKDALRFRIESLEIELTVTVGRDVEGGGGIKFWVVDASGKYTSNESNTHTLKLKLAPVAASGREVLVSDKSKVPPALAGKESKAP